MKFVFERMKLVIEPSAAVPLAVALYSEEFKNSMKQKASHKPLNVGIVFSGGNVDLSVLSKLFDRL
jgi:threonine dehydratase